MEENKEKVTPTVESGNIVINEAAVLPEVTPGEQIQSPSQVPVIEQKPVKKKGPITYIILAVVLIVLGYLIFDRFVNKKEEPVESNPVENTNTNNSNTNNSNTNKSTIENQTTNDTTNETVSDIVNETIVKEQGNFTMKAARKSNGCNIFKINDKVIKESCKLGSNDIDMQEMINDKYVLVHYVEGVDAYELVDSSGNKLLDAGDHIIGHVEQNGNKVSLVVFHILYNDNNVRDIAGCNPETAGNYKASDIVQELYEANVVDGVIQTPVKTRTQTIGDVRSEYDCEN